MPICRRTVAALARPMLISGCVVYPTLSSYNEPECHLHRYKVGMKMAMIDPDSAATTGDPDAAAVLFFSGPVTAVVSGTVFVTGNLARKLENAAEVYVRKKTGHCAGNPPGTPVPQPADAIPSKMALPARLAG